MPSRAPGSRPILLVAHPGHELLVHDWMVQCEPMVLVLADGSGLNSAARIEQSRRVIEATGAVAGRIFGYAPETRYYDAILRRDVGLFATIAAAVCDALDQCDATDIVSDAVELGDPLHDLCSMVAALSASTRPRVKHWEIPIERRIDPDAPPPGCHVRRLSAEAL